MVAMAAVGAGAVAAVAVVFIEKGDTLITTMRTTPLRELRKRRQQRRC